MMSNVLSMFPREDIFTNRKTPANLSTGPEFLLETPMWIDDAQRYCGSDCSLPTVNSRFDTTDDDAKAIVQIVVGMWAVFLAAGIVLAMVYVPGWGQ